MAKAKTEHEVRVSQQDLACGQPTENSPQKKNAEEDDIDPFSTLVHGNRDYVPQPAQAPAADSRYAVKKRIGTISSTGVSQHIPGLPWLFSEDATDDDPTPIPLPVEASKRQIERGPNASNNNACSNIPATSRGVKRGRGRPPKRKRAVEEEDADDEEHGSDFDTKPAQTPTQSIFVNDIPALTKFFQRRFDEMTMKPLRKITTEWVGRLEPKRQSKYGRYDGKLPTERKTDSPPWWPLTCPYREPSHLKREHLVPFAAELMLVHRRVDEESGKRKGDWISQLRKQAVYVVESIPAETFSSSREDVFNDSMKDRALKEILPSLFDIGQAYADYVTQFELFEGSGRKDPLKAKQITWRRCPRPYRGVPPKRPRISRTIRFVQDEDPGEETEVEDTCMMTPGTSFNSIPSAISDRDDAVMIKEESSSPRPLNIAVPMTNVLPMNQINNLPPHTAIAEPASTLYPTFHQPYSGVPMGDMSQMDTKPNTDLQLAYGAGDPSQQAFACMGGPLQTYALPYQQWPSDGHLAFYANGLPLDGAMEGVQSTSSFQPSQVEPSQVPLPFGPGCTPGIQYSTFRYPHFEPSPYDALTQDRINGLPMDFHG